MLEAEATPPSPKPAPTRSEVAAWMLVGLALLVVLWLHLLPALLAGLLVYELVHLTAPLWQRYLSNERARVVAVSALAVLVVGLVTALVTWLVVYLRGEGHLTRLLQKMADHQPGPRHSARVGNREPARQRGRTEGGRGALAGIARSQPADGG